MPTGICDICGTTDVELQTVPMRHGGGIPGTVDWEMCATCAQEAADKGHVVQPGDEPVPPPPS